MKNLSTQALFFICLKNKYILLHDDNGCTHATNCRIALHGVKRFNYPITSMHKTPFTGFRPASLNEVISIRKPNTNMP